MSTKEVLLSSNFWSLNKSVVQSLGLENTFILCLFADAEKMYSNKDGWFYQTCDKVEQMSGVKRSTQDKVLKNLKELGIIEQKNMGVPRKRHFRINEKVLNEVVCWNQADCNAEKQQTGSSDSCENKESSTKERNKETTKGKKEVGFSEEMKAYPRFLQEWEDYLEMRKEIKFPLFFVSQRKKINSLKNYCVLEATHMLLQSTQGQWRGIKELQSDYLLNLQNHFPDAYNALMQARNDFENRDVILQPTSQEIKEEIKALPNPFDDTLQTEDLPSSLLEAGATSAYPVKEQSNNSQANVQEEPVTDLFMGMFDKINEVKIPEEKSK